MKKIKVSEATGKQLDWLVLKANRNTWQMGGEPTLALMHYCTPSTDWAQGGPIIEREGISTAPTTMLGMGAIYAWMATIYVDDEEPWQMHGPTPLIAAMRTHVASKLGDEPEVPEELT